MAYFSKMGGSSIGVLAAAAFTLLAGSAFADTTVKCTTPQIEVNSGNDGTPPRMTLHCLGGSSVTGINYYAVEVSANPVVAQMILQVYQAYLSAHKNALSVSLSSNIADTSGNAWGCSETNCRILDYSIGQ